MRCLFGGLRGGFAEGVAEALGRLGEAGVANGGSVASHVDRVHDGEGAADTKGEAQEEADDRGPGETHVELSLQVALLKMRAGRGWGFACVGRVK